MAHTLSPARSYTCTEALSWLVVFVKSNSSAVECWSAPMARHAVCWSAVSGT
ncbi:UNVERIFIED_CONTAM: hypothetical protein RKD50_000181 [Streptomyces canus]